VEVLGAVPNRARAKRRARRTTRGKPASDGEARYSSGVVRKGDGSGTKFYVLTRGDLSASVEGREWPNESAREWLTVVVEKPRTRQRWDERSRRVE
jgi:hypothetical protein